MTGDLDASLHDKVLGNIPNDPSKTMGLQSVLKIAENLQAEVTANADIEDGLTNGASCLVKYLDYRVPGFERCSIIWVLFDDDNIGKNLRHQYNHLKKSSCDPNI